MIDRFRPYAVAWESVYTAGFTLDQVRRRGLSLATGLAARGLSCLIAYDTRFMGGLFARDLGAVMQACGVRAILSAAPTPLPALYHALDRRLADCALYVSACNRPYVHNGLVLIAPNADGLTLAPSNNVGDVPFPLDTPFPPAGELTSEQTVDLRASYLDTLRNTVDLELIRRTSLTIFVDAMNGTTAGIFPALLGESGHTRAIEINREPDPLFGRIAPAPNEAGLNRLKKLVRESDSHLGLAISADGTALAVIDKNGEQLDPAETALLLAAYFARQYRQRGSLVMAAPGPASPLAGLPRLAAWEEATGLRVEGLGDPGARLAELIGRDRASTVLGATAEGELIVGRYAAYPDAVLAGLFCAEMVARGGGSLRTLIDAQRDQLLRA